MSRTTAPLLSFNASGQIAKTQVYASWKGRPYVRRYVIPANPQTAEQTLTRDTFSWLNAVWRFMPSAAQAAWTQYANNSRFTARNGWIKQNLATLRDQADLTGLVFSPASAGGMPAASVVLTPGNDQIGVAATPPTLPSGWTINAMHVLAIRQQDPQSGALYELFYDSDDTDPYDLTLTGLASAQTYAVGAWFEYQKTPTQKAYGLSSYGTALTT